jgi:hypothetical protein
MPPSSQIVVFLSSGKYYYALYEPGIFFPTEGPYPYTTVYTVAPPAPDWISYIRSQHLEIFNGVEWQPIHIESVFETLVAPDGYRIPVFKIAKDTLPSIYNYAILPHTQIYRVSKTAMLIESLLRKSTPSTV